MYRIEKAIHTLAAKANWISIAAILGMMVITVLDVILRFFRRPIPGTYDIVGLLGALAISFSLAYTSVEKGHIAVEFLVQRLSEKKRAMVDSITSLVSTLFFFLASWRCYLYALDFKSGGEVSMTIKMPVYPFVLGTALGCALLTLVLALSFARSLREAIKK